MGDADRRGERCAADLLAALGRHATVEAIDWGKDVAGSDQERGSLVGAGNSAVMVDLRERWPTIG